MISHGCEVQHCHKLISLSATTPLLSPMNLNSSPCFRSDSKEAVPEPSSLEASFSGCVLGPNLVVLGDESRPPLPAETVLSQFFKLSDKTPG